MGTKIGTPEWAAKRAAVPESNIVPLAALPTDFNATSAWPQCADIIGHIRDQSDCGCCWAFGSTESFNDRLCITHNVTALLAVEDTCSCCTGGGSSSGCDGGFTEDAFNWFATVGVVTGGDYQDIGKGTSCQPFQLESWLVDGGGQASS
jgi:cathepsin B